MKEKKRGSRPVNNPVFILVFFLSKCKVCQRMCGISVRLSASVAFLVSSAGFKHVISKHQCPNQGLLS